MKSTQRSVRFFSEGNPLVILLVINTLLFAFLQFILIAFVLGNQSETESRSGFADFLNWFVVSPDLPSILSKPWTLITHLFVQETIWQLIGNLLFLWSFGYLLQDLTGNRHIIPLYLYGGMLGLVLFLLVVNLVPRFEGAVSFLTYTGPGACVMAVALGITTLSPRYRLFPMIFGGIPLWVLTLVFVLIDLAGMGGSLFPYHLAHLGGALAGFLYMKAVIAGKDPGDWMHRFYHWTTGLFRMKASGEKKHPFREKVFYQTGGTEPYKVITERSQQRIDTLLDKINRSGYDSLTLEEKEFLKRASEN